MQSELYTAGIWVAKPGCEEAFKQAWEELARWTHATFEGAISVVLLQDTANPRRFISVGPWRSSDDIEKWRATDEFKNAVGRMRPLLESFEPGSYVPVVNLP
jgi:heme-degrading monooxygenase HmoA